MTNEIDRSSPELEATLARLTDRILSLRARIGHIALLLASVGMFVLVAALLATEPTLPARAQWAFGAMLVVALSWAGYAVWVLSYRRTLLAFHRIVAGRMAVAFTGLFAMATLIGGLVTGSRAAALAAGTGAIFFALSCALLRQAHRRFTELQGRRASLEREIG